MSEILKLIEANKSQVLKDSKLTRSAKLETLKQVYLRTMVEDPIDGTSEPKSFSINLAMGEVKTSFIPSKDGSKSVLSCVVPDTAMPTNKEKNDDTSPE